MAREPKAGKKPIEQYDHLSKKRVNNPPIGLVTPELDREKGVKAYAYDPHLDPELQWSDKAEHASFEVPTVSLRVHERIDPRTIIEAVRKKNTVKIISVLRKDFKPDSDVDVLVSFSPEARHTLFDHVEKSRNYIRRKAILESVEPYYVQE